jgi:hypothetical protein
MTQKVKRVKRVHGLVPGRRIYLKRVHGLVPGRRRYLIPMWKEAKESNNNDANR